jgi:hypothetical protein
MSGFSRLAWHQLEPVAEHGQSRIWLGIHVNPHFDVVYEIIYNPFSATRYPETEPDCLVRRSDGEKLGFFASLDEAQYAADLYL